MEDPWVKLDPDEKRNVGNRTAWPGLLGYTHVVYVQVWSSHLMGLNATLLCIVKPIFCKISPLLSK